MTALSRLRLLAVLLASVALAVGAASAQDAAPAPDTAPADAPIDVPAGGAPPLPAQSGGPVRILSDTAAPTRDADDVDVGDLAAPGIDRIGLIDNASGGFSPQMWRGTDFELLKRILPQLPRRSPSPAVRRLARNLLLSPGTPPVISREQAEAQSAENLSASQWLIETRVTTLAALGHWTEVQALLELVPADQMTDSLARAKVESSLVTSHVNEACAQTQAALNVTPDPYWQKIQVFCQLNVDQTSAAGLGLALLREQKVADPMFFWAVDVMGGNAAPFPAAFTKLEPLHYAMLRKAAAPLPANLADILPKISDASTLGWLAMMPLPDAAPIKGDKTPAAVRAERRRALEDAQIVLAERAVAAGTLAPAQLRAVYTALNTADPAPPPLTQITADNVRGRAFLYQSAAAQTGPTARAAVIARAFDLVRADGGRQGPGLGVIGPVYSEMLAGMEPTADLVWFAGAAARGLLVVEDAAVRDKAKGWLELARSMGRTSREAGQIAGGLWPIEAMMTGTAATMLPPQAMRSWVSSLPADMAAEVIAQRQESVLSLLVAVGEPVETVDWLAVMGGARRSADVSQLAPHLANGLTLASKAGRAGETAALALVALGEDGPASAGVSAVQIVIEALRAAGRESDARALAVETALTLGL